VNLRSTYEFGSTRLASADSATGAGGLAEDGRVDLVQAGEQGALVTLAGEDAVEGGGRPDQSIG